MREAVIVSAVRTPVGRLRGFYSNMKPYELGAYPIPELLRRANVAPEEVDQVILGNTTNVDTSNVTRMAALHAGLPYEVPALLFNRNCATSLDAAAHAAILIEAGYADIMIAGGFEHLTQRPYILEKPAAAYQYQAPKLKVQFGFMPPELHDLVMGETAENIAETYGISRRDCDEFALWSVQKAAAAFDKGYFKSGILPVELTDKKGNVSVLQEDETLRRDTTIEKLGKLKPSFRPEGVHTAGNSSPLSDGASAVLLMERKRAEDRGLHILGIFKGYTVAGVDGHYMGKGPIAAVSKLFEKYGLTVDDIDLFELNEAFAAQSILCQRELHIPDEKLNVNGGAIALGHPFADTGTILVGKLLYEMERRDARRGIVTFCVGGGQGVAALFER